MTNHIETANALIAKKAKQAKSFDSDIRKNPLAFKAAIEVMANAELAKANAEKDKNKVFYVAMNKGGLPAFFDSEGKQNRAVAMDLSGLRKCASEDLHSLDDVDFKAMIANHEKAISSLRQFATDYFKKPNEPKGNDDAGDGQGGNDGNDDALLDTPTEKSVSVLYHEFISNAFAGNPKAFWTWVEKGNHEAIESAMINAKRKAQPELPELKSLAV